MFNGDTGCSRTKVWPLLPLARLRALCSTRPVSADFAGPVRVAQQGVQGQNSPGQDLEERSLPNEDELKVGVQGWGGIPEGPGNSMTVLF